MNNIINKNNKSINTDNKNINTNKNNYKYFPKNKDELKKIIEQEIEINGNNCNLNIIDTSRITDMSYLFWYSKFNGDINN